MMKGRDRQTMADAALMATGSMEGIFDMSRKNNVAVSDDINGVELNETGVIDSKAKEYISIKNHVPATEAILQIEDEFVTDSQGNILTTNQNENIEL